MRELIKNKDTLFLLFVLLLATILRFYNAFNIPFTHDEFSALFRLEYDSFSELIAYGVTPDGHPAGVQVFLYYWTKLFGFKEIIVKLPFILMGIGSVYLLWLIAKNWYNTTVALLVALLLATLEYPLMHSQIARPYISGLFFSLWMVYEWSQYLFNTKSKFNKHLVFYVLASAFCAYNHHFSLLFATIVGISGLFFIKRKRFLAYILSGFSIFLVYTPHLSIFFYQLNTGGIGGKDGWLGIPKNDFLWEYIRYIFNFSWPLMGILLLIIFIGLIKQPTQKKKFFYLSFTWFLLPFFIGFFYSIKVNPVLQYSVLIFSFPFLFFILFGHLGELSSKRKAIGLIVLTPLLIASLVFGREYYTLFYQSPYEGIVNNTFHFQEGKKATSGMSIINSNKKFTKYYVNKVEEEFSYVNFGEFNYYEIDKFTSRKELISLLDTSKENNLSYGSLSLSDAAIPAIIYDYFPVLRTKVDYNQGNYFEFSKNGNNSEDVYRSKSFENTFGEDQNLWTIKETSIFLLDSLNEIYAFKFSNGQEWGLSFEVDFDTLGVSKNDLIDIRLDIKSVGEEDELLIVTEIIDDKVKHDWRATSNKEFRLGEDSSIYRMYHSLKLSDINLQDKDKRLKVYCWNKGKSPIIVTRISIKIRIGNPIIYGLLKEIKKN